MGNFLVPGEEDFNGEGFGILAEDRYRVRVQSYQIKSGAEVTNQYNPNGDERVWFTLEPLYVEGDPDSGLLDPEGKEVNEDKTLLFFFDPKRLGLKPQVAKSRKFFAAAMGIPVEQRVVFADLKDLCDSLIGREMLVDVEINQKGVNVVKNPAPVKKRGGARESRPSGNTDLAAQAAAIFNETPAEAVEAPVEEPAY